MEPTNIQEELFQEYDYIVVGAGSSGCVIASRLSEDPDCTVLVLEAGGDDRDYPDIPIPGKCENLGNTDCDWGFQMVPQRNAFKGYKNEMYNTICGKVLGGSSAINYMVYMRGTPHDYDTWENMGCEGWGYKDVLPYFIKSETCQIKRFLDSGCRGTSGAMVISEAEYSPLADLFLKGGEELGYPETDCNSHHPIGFMAVQSNIGEGVRQSSAECFLRPASTRPNLHIAVRCHVTKILINNHEAQGVQFYQHHCEHNICCRREVIVSAGAYNSPKILMLSGIGPKDHLQTLGISVVQYLPVGNNLQEHTTVLGLEFEMDTPLSCTSQFTSSQSAIDMYRDRRAGPLAAGVLEVTGLIRTPCQDPGNPNSDVQLTSLSGLIGAGKHGRPGYMASVKDDVFEALFEGSEGRHGFGIALTNTRTRSRGTVRLTDTKPFSKPLIDHQTLTDHGDVATLIEGIKFAMQLAETKAFKSVGTRFTKRVLPNYDKTPFTDDYWAEYARTLTNTFHPAGSCRMGRIQDSTTVVDPQLRVKGIKGLSVADASIMPEITSANLHATCVMIGEKAADLIKQRYSDILTDHICS